MLVLGDTIAQDLLGDDDWFETQSLFRTPTREQSELAADVEAATAAIPESHKPRPKRLPAVGGSLARRCGIAVAGVWGVLGVAGIAVWTFAPEKRTENPTIGVAAKAPIATGDRV